MTREEWLMRAAAELRSHVFPDYAQPPRVWVSVGFPKGSRGRGKAIGQCWDGALSTDGAAHVFIHPALLEPETVLATLAHELVHAAVGVEAKHRGPFVELARKVGLVKPWTATSPGPELLARLADIARGLGAYEHAGLDPATIKRQVSRMRKWECPCGIIVRAGSDDLQALCQRCEMPFLKAEA